MGKQRCFRVLEQKTAGPAVAVSDNSNNKVAQKYHTQKIEREAFVKNKASKKNKENVCKSAKQVLEQQFIKSYL